MGATAVLEIAAEMPPAAKSFMKATGSAIPKTILDLQREMDGGISNTFDTFSLRFLLCFVAFLVMKIDARCSVQDGGAKKREIVSADSLGVTM